MNTLTALAGTLGLSIGWCIGHSTARIRHVPVGATHEQDQAALDAADEQLITEWRARLDQLTAPFEPPTEQPPTDMAS
ncbi:MAG TPA: hypothetical protein VKZ65_11785 [Glycomyces sp.]|nr:hypothetical protein [Glycomyces sp.]